MRRIGLIGGMSWESTAEYYRLANQLVVQRLGGYHSARILLDSVDFAEIEAMQATGDWASAAELLTRSALALEQAGADVLVLCTNTMHIIADSIETAVDVPFLHLADVTAAAVRKAGVTRVGLLGTAFTMEQPFYRDRLASHGLDVRTPGPSGRALVHHVIYDELVHGRTSTPSRNACRRVIRALVDAGAEGVILGCTELELLITEEDSPVPIFPTTRLHVEAAVDAALRD